MRITGVLLTLAAIISPLRAQTSYPMITHVTPIAVQRGKTTEVTVEGQMNFQGVYKALVQGTGVKAEAPAAAEAKETDKKAAIRAVKMKLSIDAAAPVGVREFRLASTLGLSSIGLFAVVDDPVIGESGDNNTLAKANAIKLPCVVCGRIEAAEDVDFFKFEAEAGQSVTFEVLSARLQDKIHDMQKHSDPLLALFDVDGRELAANDDFYFADSLLTFVVPKTGSYSLQIRDSKYDGDPRWVYAVAATNRPHITHVFPFVANPGQTLDVEPVGTAAREQAKVKLRAPMEPGLGQVRLDLKSGPTNPTAFLVAALPPVLEQEPNDLPEQAIRLPIPAVVSGRIGKRRDLDHFLFAAKKGVPIRFEVKARRFGTGLQSGLDSMLDVLDKKGATLASNDDAFGKDSMLVFAPPADGEYILRLRDLNSKGGDTFVYCVEADLARPDFALRVDSDKAMIGPKSSTAWFVHVNRLDGFAGPVKVDVEGLPKGVKASPLTIPPSMSQGLIVLTAADDTACDAANVAVVGTATATPAGGKEEQLRRIATPNQEIYLPGGGRGRFDVGMQTVAVTEQSDIVRVEVSPKQITLKPGEEVRLDVTIERRKDYDKPVTIDILLRHLGTVYGNPLPPGVTLLENSKTKTSLGTGNKGHIVLKAAADAAPIENVPIGVLANVSINFVVKISYSSEPILLTIMK